MINILEGGDHIHVKVARSAFDRPMRLGEYAEVVLGYLRTLTKVDPIFAAGKVWVAKKRKSLPFAVDDPDPVSRLVEYMDMPVDRDFNPPLGFSDCDQKGRATPASTYPLGIGFTYHVAVPTEGRIRMLVSDGAWGGAWDRPVSGQIVHVSLPTKGDARYSSCDFAEAVLRASVGYWVPSCAEINRNPFLDAVGDANDEVRIGWCTYLGQPGAIDRLPADVICERIAPGGALVKLHGDTFDPADAGQIAEAKRIRDALRGRSLREPNHLKLAADAEVIGRGLPALDLSR